jgi:DNA processing protein
LQLHGSFPKKKNLEQERLSMLALHFVPGIGNYLFRQLISYCGGAEQVFKTPKGKLLKIPGIGSVTAESIRTGDTFNQAAKEFRRAEKDHSEIVFFTDKDYPSRLKVLDDSPAVLYLKGSINLNHPRTVGIVGTRQATPYGKEIVEKTVAELVPHQALIISGLAYGIDIHAHKQAVKHKLPTIGVMGSGIDIIYPAPHRDTAIKMLDNGGLVTENHFGTSPDAHNFPARNRIIAGLCDALIIVEAAEKGGALITAEIANSYNKDVFAVPGNIGLAFSRGCNKLIKINKAHLFTSVRDMEYIMNWSSSPTPAPAPDLSKFPADERKVVEVLMRRKSPVMIDELSYQTGVPLNLLASVLLTLEFGGVIVSMPGQQFKLTSR